MFKKTILVILALSAASSAFAMSPVRELIASCKKGGTRVDVYRAGPDTFVIDATSRKSIFGGERELSVWAESKTHDCSGSAGCDGSGAEYFGKGENGESAYVSVVADFLSASSRFNFNVVYADGKKKSGTCTTKF